MQVSGFSKGTEKALAGSHSSRSHGHSLPDYSTGGHGPLLRTCPGRSMAYDVGDQTMERQLSPPHSQARAHLPLLHSQVECPSGFQT